MTSSFRPARTLAYYGAAGPIFNLFTLSMNLTVLPPAPCFQVWSSNGIQLSFSEEQGQLRFKSVVPSSDCTTELRGEFKKKHLCLGLNL